MILISFSATLQRLSHSCCDHPWEYNYLFKKLKIVGTRDHHVHHLMPHKNFADLFSFWDILFQTYRDPNTVKSIQPML